MRYEVPSVVLAVRILKLLSRYKHRSCSLKEIAELTGASKTTCLRVLRSLEQEDILKYDAERRKYSLGPYLIPLGNRALALNDFLATATSELTAVARETGLTTVLIERLRDDRLIYIASEEPEQDNLRIAVSVGQSFPIVGAGFGHCFIAYGDEASWPRYARQLTPFSPNSIVNPDVFYESLRQIRRNGYAVSHGALAHGVSAVAAPIFADSGEVELVMSSLAMTVVLTPELQERALRVLLEHTLRLSEWNGWQPLH
ncbi:IclR family transcriptional regulator [Alicyclobacillus sp. ALC3]|nr:IclR family transcriptional regulator [Alicyclobacillus sp. ALC3]